MTPSRVLLETSLLVRAGAPDEALALLRATDFKSEGDGAMAEAAELEGLALESLQRPAEALEAYRRAVAAAAGSEAATRSRERLAALGG
jgi:predicted negative regulator of RcsB-dependent stress response